MAQKLNPKVYQIINVIAVLAALIFNSLVNIIRLNGVTTGEVSDYYPSLFTPPGYVFAIWFVIYLTAIIFMIYQALPSQRGAAYLGEISFLYLTSSIINIVWLVAFHYSYGNPSLLLVTIILIALLLVNLLWIYVRMRIGKITISPRIRLAIQIHFSIYLGWISLATIANLASALNVLLPGLTLDIQALWTAAVIIIALLITLLMIYLRRDFAFGLVVIWASIGIAIKQITILLIFGTALCTAIAITIAILVVPFLKKTGYLNYYLARE